ncbi:MAG: class I SAM-dependent rRNA methyltransferase [Prevotella sp.]|nr:class I SAM-dependent rRNA methyltransferase [Prevotella sp.]
MGAYKSVYLKKGKDESIQRFHPWVFSGAVARIDSGISEGDTVRVISSEGECLGVGHYQIGSIAVRLLTFEDIEITSDFWASRIAAALRVRQAANLAWRDGNDIFRLVYGEGDGLPGLIVDCFGDTAVMQAHTAGMHINRQSLCEAVIAATEGKVKNIYYKSAATLPYKAGLDPEDDFIIGGNACDIATENGMRFRIDWRKGQKTGFFIDQRDNRSLVERYARDRSVLNMFCYTGGFSVAAMRGGATKVCSVDSSERAITLADENVQLNFPGDTRHEAVCSDAFKFLAEAANKYDLIILDPPAFAKHRMAVKNALKGYIRLNARGIAAIRPGGILFTFSCSQAVSREQFGNAVFTAATLARRNVRILHRLGQPADHPVNIFHPEGEYLKGLVLFVE